MECTRNDYTFKSSDNTNIALTAWTPKSKVKLVLHIVHGMTEHILRYEVLANELAKSGVMVVGMDLRGHGRNIGNPKCASLGENGYESTLKDIEFLNGKIKEKYPNLPLVMLGFSLGSFILRDYLSAGHDEVYASIIAGTGSQPKFVLSLLKKVVLNQISKVGFNNSSPLVTQLSFGTYNKNFAPNRTSADWLCSDKIETDKYLNDDLCKKEISAGLFYQLIDSMQRTGDVKTYEKWNKNMQVLLISGEFDPVGNNMKGVKQVENQMKKAGFKSVGARFIENARHDIFHEYENRGAHKAEQLISAFLHHQINNY